MRCFEPLSREQQFEVPLRANIFVIRKHRLEAPSFSTESVGFCRSLRDTTMLQCDRRESAANSGRSDWSKVGGKCSALLAGHLVNNERRREPGHEGPGHGMEKEPDNFSLGN